MFNQALVTVHLCALIIVSITDFLYCAQLQRSRMNGAALHLNLPLTVWL